MIDFWTPQKWGKIQGFFRKFPILGVFGGSRDPENSGKLGVKMKGFFRKYWILQHVTGLPGVVRGSPDPWTPPPGGGSPGGHGVEKDPGVG